MDCGSSPGICGEFGMFHRGCDYLADFYSGGHLFVHFLPDALQQQAELCLDYSPHSPTWLEWGKTFWFWEQLLSPAVWAAGVPSPFAGMKQWTLEVEQSSFMKKYVPRAAAWAAGSVGGEGAGVRITL